MVNKYFDNLAFQNENERDLLDDLFIQSIQLSGMDVYYIPRTQVNVDSLFGADILSKFEKKFLIEMYLKTYDGFNGLGNVMTFSGEFIDKNVEFQVSAKRFKEEVSILNRPMEGDYIMMPMNKNLFEITFADHEERFWIYGKTYLWTIKAEKVKYSSERIDTNIRDIDKIEVENSNMLGSSIGIRLINGGWKYQGTPTVQIIGDCTTPATAIATINSSGTVLGIVVINPGAGYLKVPEIKIIGNGHGAKAQAFLLDESTDKLNDADKIQAESDIFLNFDEKDPFSLDGKV